MIAGKAVGVEALRGSTDDAASDREGAGSTLSRCAADARKGGPVGRRRRDWGSGGMIGQWAI